MKTPYQNKMEQLGLQEFNLFEIELLKIEHFITALSEKYATTLMLDERSFLLRTIKRMTNLMHSVRVIYKTVIDRASMMILARSIIDLNAIICFFFQYVKNDEERALRLRLFYLDGVRTRLKISKEPLKERDPNYISEEIAYFCVADRFNIIDKPNLRSSHTSVTLRGGGIIFLLGAWAYAAFFGLAYPWFLVGLSLIALISFVDDIHSLPDSLRLIVQFIAMGLMFYQFGILNLSDWWMVIIALIVSVGIINAYNFMDGINGITGGYSIAVLLPLIYLNRRLDFISQPYLYVTGLSLIVFCFFNFRKKAKCFAGDVGSISIAFILLFALGRLILQTGDLSYLTFLAVYGVDSVLTICHRIKLHENLGEAHRKHAYQLMANELRIPHTVISAFYAILQLAVSFGLIFMPVNHYMYMGIVIVVLVVAYVAFMYKNYHLHEAYLLKSKQI